MSEAMLNMASAVPRAPSLLTVTRQQLRLIDAHGRFPFLIGLLAGLPIVFIVNQPAGVSDRDAALPILGHLCTACVWPFFVWIGELPRQRGYHRNLPVNHVTHDLIKVIAGACWLMLGVALVLTAQLLMLIAAGYRSWVWGLSPAALLNFFTGSLIIYLFFSLIPILTNKPIEWLIGLTLFAGAVTVPLSMYARERTDLAIELLLRSDLGLVNALGGGYGAQPWPYLPDSTSVMTTVQHSTGMWLIATALWTGLAFMLVCLASSFANRRSIAR
jgi:hypothetical protein